MEETMAQCKQCGNKGLFLRVNAHGFCEKCNNSLKQKELEKAKEQERRWEEAKRKIQEDDRVADKQIKQLNDACNKYLSSGEYDKLIAVYEEVFSVPTTWNSASHKLSLVEYYQKSGQNDKAWALLNSIVLDYPDEAYRVRRYQYLQLKNEKKYLEALKIFFLYKFNDCKSITCWSEVKERECTSFLKEAQMLAKKAMLDTDAIFELVNIFISLVESSRSTEATAFNRFKEWYNSIAKQGIFKKR